MGYTIYPLESIVLGDDDHFFIFGLDEPKNRNQQKRNKPLQVWKLRILRDVGDSTSIR